MSLLPSHRMSWDVAFTFSSGPGGLASRKPVVGCSHRWSERSDNASGVAHRENARGEIRSDDAARTHDGVLADGHSGTDDHTSSEPDPLTDRYRGAGLPPFLRFSASSGCVAVSSWTFVPICTSDPMLIGATS